MKKLIAFILTLSLLTGGIMISVSASELPYTDVKKSAWYYNDVKYVTDGGIMNGVSNSRFEASATLSRAMAVTILYRMADGAVVSDTENPFGDVPNGKWYSDAVLWAYGCGIVKGKTETAFEPNSSITRAEFATMLSRYAYTEDLDLPEIREETNFADSVITPKYAQTAEKILYTAGIINGFPDNRFMHYQTITRAEAAAMIHRFNEAAEPLDKDAYTDVVFIGNSITSTGKTPAHFEALAEGKNVKVYNHSIDGNRLEQHYEWFLSENMSVYTGRVQNAEVVILQEYGGLFPKFGADEDLLKYPEYSGAQSLGTCFGDNTVGKIMDFLGGDKEYYSYSASAYLGVLKYDEYLNWRDQIVPNINDDLMAIKKIIKEKYGVDHVYASDIATFEPSLGITNEETFPDSLHPTELMGYVIALVMYCEIFDVPATEQNNGVLSEDKIPGNTPEEKAQFMEKLKATVQEIIDIQKLDK